MERIEISKDSSVRLRKALFFYLGAALLAMVLSLAITISLTLFDRLKRAEDKSLFHAVQTRAMAIDEWCRRAKDLSWQITSRTRIREELEKFNQGQISHPAVKSFTEPKLQDAMDLSEDIIGILRLDKNRRVIAACGYGADLPMAHTALGEYIFDEIHLLAPLTINGTLSIVASAPIFNRNGERQGTDLVVFDTYGLRSIVSSSQPIGRTGSSSIGYQSNGHIAYLFPQNLDAIKSPGGSDAFNAINTAFFKAIAGQAGIENISDTLVTYAPVTESDWGVVITQGEKELYLPLYRKMAIIGIFFLLIYLLTLFGFGWVMKPLAGRILLHADELEKAIQEKTRVLEQEIDRRAELEKLLREKEQFLSSVFDSIQDGISVLSPDLRIIHTNKAMQAWYEKHLPMENKACYEVFRGSQSPCDDCPTLRSINSREIEMQEVPLVRDDGEAGVLEVYAYPFFDEDNKLKGAVKYVRDISLRKQAEEALKASLTEKEVLLKEIHHRVKNNMQVISSLVDLQACEVKDETMCGVFKDVNSRVRAMALVHEKLYQSNDFAHVDFADYSRSLLVYLWRAQGRAIPGVNLEMDLKPVFLPVNEAVPCGLMLNELFTNALKHAFIGRETGEVTVSLDSDGRGKCILSVADDGIGLPQEVDWQKGNSLGLRLVQMLARQVHAAVEMESDQGTMFRIVFEAPESNVAAVS